jgi:hypothetical protein
VVDTDDACAYTLRSPTGICLHLRDRTVHLHAFLMVFALESGRYGYLRNSTGLNDADWDYVTCSR